MTARRPTADRLLPVLAAMASLTTLAACGSDGSQAQPAGQVGSPENPAVARSSPAGGEPTTKMPGARREPERSSPRGETERPSYDGIVRRQQRRPRQRFTPCNLVTRKQAQAILGAAVLQPQEAPQGPTCIYRTRGNSRFVTLAVQSAALGDLKRHLRDVERVRVSSRPAYCGKAGQPVLYVPLGRSRVLSIAAPCNTARRFASTALSRLKT